MASKRASTKLQPQRRKDEDSCKGVWYTYLLAVSIVKWQSFCYTVHTLVVHAFAYISWYDGTGKHVYRPCLCVCVLHAFSFGWLDSSMVEPVCKHTYIG